MVHAPVPPTINGPNRLICLVRSVPNVEPAPPSCCRLATAKPCSSISTRSQPKSPSERTPLSSLIRPAGMAPRPSRFQTTSRSCSFRRAHPNSTARKTFGSSCVRIACQTGFSNPSTISSTTAATLGTHSLTNPGRLCPSRDATGQQSVTQSEDWYYRHHQQAGDRRSDAGADEGERKRHPQLGGQQRGGVGTDAVERRLADGKLPRIAEQHLQPHRRDRGDCNQAQNVKRELVRFHPRQHDQRRHDQQRDAVHRSAPRCSSIE